MKEGIYDGDDDDDDDDDDEFYFDVFHLLMSPLPPKLHFKQSKTDKW